MTTAEVARHVRVSFRQLDYWVRFGLLPIVDRRPGTGSKRLWSASEIHSAEVMAALVHAGVTPHAAAEALQTAVVGSTAFVVQLGRLWLTGPLP
jgi:DNA-binding transcriptional MerR regulator